MTYCFILCVCVCLVIVCLYFFSYVMRLMVSIRDAVEPNSEENELNWFLQQIFFLLYYTNFAINFLLYSIYGTTFRHCLYRLIREKVDGLRRLLRLKTAQR